MPTVIITGDRDAMVSPQINARALAATLPSAKLILLENVGHMPHHAAPEVVTAAVEQLCQRRRGHMMVRAERTAASS
jgi:pimeloyl-ACP methyl ester carboxylesterase